jgi:hypothetical protein
VRRYDNWPERLAALVERARARRFVWGQHDCMTFAADAVRAMTGIDPIAGWRGRYASEEEGDALLGPDGLESFVAHLMAGLGVPEASPRHVQRGDWAMVTLPRTDRLWNGVCLGESVAMPAEHGLVFVPAARVARCWRI